MADFVLDQRLRWLGYLGRMSSDRLPKQLLFGELLKRRPFYGAKKRWRDEVMSDLRAISVEDWYVACQDRERWSNLCAIAVDEVAQCREGVLPTEHPRKGIFLAFVEDISNAKEI